jgi:phosphatidate cytidylyltransferase
MAARSLSSSRARTADTSGSPAKTTRGKKAESKSVTKRTKKENENEISTPVKRGKSPAHAKSPEKVVKNNNTPAKVKTVVKKQDDESPEPVKSRQSIRPVSRSPVVVDKPHTIAKVSPLGADHDGTSRCKSFFQRLWAGLVLFSIFCGGIHLGHTVLIPAVFAIQFMMYKEMVDLSYSHLLQENEKQFIPLFRPQNWFWFIVASFYSYSRILEQYTQIQVPHYLFISVSLFFLGFVGFVLTLRSDIYQLQFANLAWTFLSILLFIIIETAVTASVMFEGLIWLVLPAILVMTNDTWAYIWGVLFGRHSLIQLSVKKTWEGFIGALISTPIQGWLMTRYMVPHAILICKQTKFFTFDHPQCISNPLYQLSPVQLPFTIPLLGWDHVLVAPMMYHAIYLSIFASIVAPFGGFFASGFKRAYAIKDFGTLIPGHGGFVDRMDCQLIMGIFVFAYYYTFIQPEQFGNAVVNQQNALSFYSSLDQAGKAAFKQLL